MRIATALSVALILITAAAAAADEFSDFRIPEHSAHLLSGSFSGAMSRDDSDRPWESRLNEDYSGFVSAQWRALHETDPASWSWGGSLSAFGLRDAGHAHELMFGTPGFEDRAGATEEVDRDVSLHAIWLRYPWQLPIGVQFAGAGISRSIQRWVRGQTSGTVIDSVTTNTLTADSRHDHQSEVQVAAQVSIGVGRVRDVSGIYRARLLARRLESSGLLTRAPSVSTVQRLAALFYDQPDFFVVHDRPDKFFWREVERLLREDGALAGSMDAFGVFRVLEAPSPLGMFFRSSGFFVGASSQAVHIHAFGHRAFAHRSATSVGGAPYNLFEDRGADGASFEANHVQVGPTGEFHRPLGLRWQIDVTSRVLFDVPNDPIRNGMQAQTIVSGTWVFADRWYMTSAVTHQRTTVTTTNGHQDSWAVYTNAILGYQVEDRLRLELSGNQSQDKSSDFYAGYDRRGELRVGVVYDVSGSLSAPGLVERQGLTPGSIGP